MPILKLENTEINNNKNNLKFGQVSNLKIRQPVRR